MGKLAEKSHPLILVFYLDREMMQNAQIIGPFTKSVNDAILAREANMMAFFLPTDEEEWVDCINPIIATKEQKESIDELLKDLKSGFDIGKGADEGKTDEENEVDTKEE